MTAGAAGFTFPLFNGDLPSHESEAMKKHWLLCVGIVTCATLAAYVVGRLLLLPPDRITYATFGTITKGMSETEVVNILGGPPTREGDGAAWGGQLPVSGPFRVWSSGGNEIHVWFDQHGRVK